MEIRCRHGLLEGQCAVCKGLIRSPFQEADSFSEDIDSKEGQEDIEEGGEQE